MKPLFLVCILIISTTLPVLADDKTLTFFRDGVIGEIEATARQGLITIPLPSGYREDTLRIKPLAGTTITGVTITTSVSAPRSEKNEALEEQKKRLNDRLKALATREQIFTAAAKSQSGKAPRKTKTNPDPLQSIRQGTDYAIAQLESVYTSRRRTEQELRQVEERIKTENNVTGSSAATARITVTPAKGRIKAAFALAQEGWIPEYILRTGTQQTALLVLLGRPSCTLAGYRSQVLNSGITLPDTIQQTPLPASLSSGVKLAEFRLPIRDEQFPVTLTTSFTLTLENTTPYDFPTGEGTLYRNGEYWGRFLFTGISSGRTRAIASPAP